MTPKPTTWKPAKRGNTGPALIAAYTGLVADLTHAATARRMLANHTRLATAGTLWLQPCWWTCHDCGLVPVTWTDSPIHITPASGHTNGAHTNGGGGRDRAGGGVPGWQIVTSGHHCAGYGTPPAGFDRDGHRIDPTPPDRQLDYTDRGHLLAELAAVADRDRTARLDLAGRAERILADQIHRAHAAVRTEIGSSRGTDPGALLTDTDLHLIADRLVYTEGDSLDRAINRAIRPDCFARVDPARWFARWLARDAESAIRVAIGDVRDHGRIVRRIAADQGLSDPDAILAAVKRQRPNLPVGAKTVHDAMALVSRAPVPLDQIDRGGDTL